MNILQERSQSIIESVENKKVFREIKDLEAFKSFVIGNEYGVNPDDIFNKDIIDIGANIGFFSVLAAELGAKQILAVEPHPKNFDYLVSNVFKYKNILPVNFAVSKSGVIKVKTNLEKQMVWTEKEQNGTVYSFTLENIIEFLPSMDMLNIVMKIDIEGSEYEILLGANDRVLQRFETIYIEMHEGQFNPKNKNIPAQKIEFLINYLNFMGFEKKHDAAFFTTEINQKGEWKTSFHEDLRVFKFEKK